MLPHSCTHSHAHNTHTTHSVRLTHKLSHTELPYIHTTLLYTGVCTGPPAHSLVHTNLHVCVHTHTTSIYPCCYPLPNTHTLPGVLHLAHRCTRPNIHTNIPPIHRLTHFHMRIDDAIELAHCYTRHPYTLHTCAQTCTHAGCCTTPLLTCTFQHTAMHTPAAIHMWHSYTPPATPWLSVCNPFRGPRVRWYLHGVTRPQ